MSRTLYLVGAGGFAREIYSYLMSDCCDFNIKDFVGFLSDYDDDLDDFNFQHKVVGKLLADLEPNAAVILGIAEPRLKEVVYEFYKSRNIDVLTFIHSSCLIGQDVALGEGSVLMPNVTITTNVSLGKCVTINGYTGVGHDAIIGDFVTASSHCDITGGVEIKKRAFLGSSVVLTPKVKIGIDAKVSAGSVVFSKVKDGVTVFGNPAKKLK